MKKGFQPSLEYASQLDSQDKLASFREAFIINDPDLIYLDGNSLGRLPKVAIERAKRIVEEEWGSDLIRGWNKGWWDEKPIAIQDHGIHGIHGRIAVGQIALIHFVLGASFRVFCVFRGKKTAI